MEENLKSAWEEWKLKEIISHELNLGTAEDYIDGSLWKKRNNLTAHSIIENVRLNAFQTFFRQKTE